MTGSRIRDVEDICKGPIIRTSVLRRAGFCGKDINELIQRGLLQRIRRGYYISPAKLDEMNTREILAALVPDAVISLFSAAQYHDLTTVIPQKLELTLPVQKRVPVLPANLHIKVYKAVPHIYLVGIQIERLLYRLSVSPYVGNFILKERIASITFGYGTAPIKGVFT
jgi:predicted transcriptional regulator of viral defense system